MCSLEPCSETCIPIIQSLAVNISIVKKLFNHLVKALSNSKDALIDYYLIRQNGFLAHAEIFFPY